MFTNLILINEDDLQRCGLIFLGVVLWMRGLGKFNIIRWIKENKIVLKLRM